MADFHLKYGSQQVDISAQGQRIVVNEKLIGFSDDKRKHRSESPVSTAATTFFAENDRYSLHVGNLPYDTTDHDLRKLFSGYNISGARIPARRRSDRTRGCGFVDMTSLRDAQNAIKSLSGVIFLGREVTVMMSRSNLSTAAVREEHDEEPPEKKLKRGGDWGRDVKKSMSQGLKYKERSGFASPQPSEPATLSTEPISVEALALEFAQLWVDEYAGPDTGLEKRTESLAGLLLELDVPDSKLHEHISRTFMPQATVWLPSWSNMTGKSYKTTFTLDLISLLVNVMHRPVPRAVKLAKNHKRLADSDLLRGPMGGRKTMEHSEEHERGNEDCVMLAKMAIDVPRDDENPSSQASNYAISMCGIR